MKTIILLITTLLIINGCSDNQKNDIKEEIKQETSFYTVEYYDQHKDLRVQRIKECKALIKMTNTEEKDCNNAYRANMGSEMPDMDF